MSSRRDCASRKANAGSLLLASLIVLAGCSTTRAPLSDVESGKALLDSALRDWKAGVPVDELKRRTPAVYVAEELWEKGFQLTDFSLDSDGELYGSNVRIKVSLHGTDRSGRKLDQSVTYLVTTTPALTITRGDP